MKPRRQFFRLLGAVSVVPLAAALGWAREDGGLIRLTAGQSVAIRGGYRVTADNRCQALVIYVKRDLVIDGSLTLAA